MMWNKVHTYFRDLPFDFSASKVFLDFQWLDFFSKASDLIGLKSHFFPSPPPPPPNLSVFLLRCHVFLLRISLLQLFLNLFRFAFIFDFFTFHILVHFPLCLNFKNFFPLPSSFYLPPYYLFFSSSHCPYFFTLSFLILTFLFFKLFPQ